jgi:hypothetical protein
MNDCYICWFFTDILLGILIIKGLIARRLYKTFSFIRLRLIQIAPHHVTRHNTPTHNILSTAPQLSIPLKTLGTLREDSNVMPKHVGATIHD